MFILHRDIIRVAQKYPKWNAKNILDEVFTNMVQALMARPAGAVVRIPPKPSVRTVRWYET